MMMRRYIGWCLAPLLVTNAAMAQEGPDENAAAAFFALTITPVGALPAIVTPAMIGGAPAVGFRAQFGYLDESGDASHRVLGLGLDLPAGRMRLGFTAALDDYACDDPGAGFGIELECKKTMMSGASLGVPLVSGAVGTQGARVDLGFEGTVGYGTGDILLLRIDNGAGGFDELEISGSGLSVTAGMPLSLAVKSSALSFVPYLIPRFGWGRANLKVRDSSVPSEDESTESGVRFMLGGGIAVLLNSGIGLSAGFQKIFIEDGKTTIGVGLSWRG